MYVQKAQISSTENEATEECSTCIDKSRLSLVSHNMNSVLLDVHA